MRKIIIFLLLLSSLSFAFEELDSSNFEEKIKGQDAIVDFYAHWCAPCHQIAEHLDFYALDKNNDVKIFKVNVELNVELALKYKARSLPTLVYIKDGKVVLTQKGFQDYQTIDSNVKQYIMNN